MVDTVLPAPSLISKNSGPSVERGDMPELPGYFPRTWAISKEGNSKRRSLTREGRERTWVKTILLDEHSVAYEHSTAAVPLHNLPIQATTAPVPGPSWLNSLDHRGPVDQAGPRFVCVVRAFEAAREFSGYPAQSFEVATCDGFPHRHGLDSSAVATDAIIRTTLDACRCKTSAGDLFVLTQLAEWTTHGKPSGPDVATTVSLHLIRFQDDRMRPLNQRVGQAHLIIADSGVRDSARQAASGLRLRYERDTGTIGPLIDEFGALVQTVVAVLDNDDAPALRAVVDRAHTVLAELGLSLSVLDKLTASARKAGALGTKFAGEGFGECVIILTDSTQATGRTHSALGHSDASATWTRRVPVGKVKE